MDYTDLDSLVGESQGATHDSGGGVFLENAAEWELTGFATFFGMTHQVWCVLK